MNTDKIRCQTSMYHHHHYYLHVIFIVIGIIEFIFALDHTISGFIFLFNDHTGYRPTDQDHRFFILFLIFLIHFGFIGIEITEICVIHFFHLHCK